MPALFDTYKLKDVTLRNRIAVSPMCQYMAQDGLANEWHTAHYASLARGGAGLVIVEASAVSPDGRITWADLGLWNDQQMEAMKPVVAAIKAAGTVPGIQIGHAGRKASANRPWEGDDHIPLGQPNSWETIAPSPLAFGKSLDRVPREMTLADIARVQQDTVRAIERARQAGFEWIQLHFAHGYLAQNFFSAFSNQRTDQYGGSPENRSRYLLETFLAVRKVWPENLPLSVRLSVIEYAGNDEEMIQQGIDLLNQMKPAGLVFADLSIGFNTPTANIPWGPNYLVPTVRRVLDATGLPGSTSWCLSRDAKSLNAMVESGTLDLVTAGRPFLDDPHYPFHLARQLGIENAARITLPPAYAHWVNRYE